MELADAGKPAIEKIGGRYLSSSSLEMEMTVCAKEGGCTCAGTVLLLLVTDRACTGVGDDSVGVYVDQCSQHSQQ